MLDESQIDEKPAPTNGVGVAGFIRTPDGHRLMIGQRLDA